ncbi:MAG: hypothetical protein RR304_02685 [Bacteroides sp.]
MKKEEDLFLTEDALCSIYGLRSKEDGMLQCRQAALAIAMTILLDLQSGEPPHSKGEIQEASEEMARYNNLLIDLSKEK